jgi:transposase
MRSTFVKERANLVNRLHKVLEGANIKLASVASDVNGVSGKAILQAMIAGGSTSKQMAELSQGRLRGKRDLLSRSLQGNVKPHHRFALSELLLRIDGLEKTITKFD